MEINSQVDNYIAKANPKFAQELERIRRVIFRELPEGEETFSYNIPVYKYGRKPIFSIAAFADHYSLITQDKNIGKVFPAELRGNVISGTTIHFNLEHPLQDSLLTKIIKYRVETRKKTLGLEK